MCVCLVAPDDDDDSLVADSLWGHPYGGGAGGVALQQYGYHEGLACMVTV